MTDVCRNIDAVESLIKFEKQGHVGSECLISRHKQHLAVRGVGKP